MHIFLHAVGSAVAVTVALLLGAGLLHLIPKLGGVGKRLSDWLCHAPGLDCIVTYFTVAPLIVAPIYFGWAGLFGAIVGQVSGVLLWVWAHERVHRNAVQGPRLVKAINQIVGPWRNHAALWLTATATPVFWIIRLLEVTAYPPLRRLVGFPQYKQGEWVNVSRHKFKDLVGFDLIWCLYCDWMTGVWSLGTEMLRNVESFWCPIRFSDHAKCENCAIDFPDVNNGWVNEGGTMEQAVQVVERMNAGGFHGWFGHPARLTAKGKEIKSPGVS